MNCFINFLAIPVVICTIFCQFSIANHVLTDEIDLNVLRQNFKKNLIADYRGRTISEPLSGDRKQEFENRIIDFKALANRNSQRKKDLSNKWTSLSRKRRSADETDRKINQVQSGIPTLIGFEEVASIPVAFPLDICLFKVGHSVHAAVLHWEKIAQKHNNNTVLAFFRETAAKSFKFDKYYEYKTKNAQHMDCVSTAEQSGLVVVTNEIDKNFPITAEAELEMGSPVFRVTENADGKVQPVKLVQFFNRKNQNRVDLWTHGNDIFLIQTIDTFNTTLRPECPIFKWTGFHFDLVQEVPCLNSMEIQKFTIHQEFYLAFANYRNDEGATSIFSYIYKLNATTEKFVLHQQLFTNAANDVKYFYFDNDHVREHFLIVANSFELDEHGRPVSEAYSMIYKFMNGFFTPFQSLQLNSVKKVLPVMGEAGEFVLLVSSDNNDIKLFQYDGWRFHAASIDYTGTSFEKGVNYMRTYKSIHNKTLIVIANERAFGDHSNIFSPTFKMHDDLEAVHTNILKWCDDNFLRLSKQNLPALLASVQSLPKIGKETIMLTGKLTLQKGRVKNLETQSLKTPKGTLDVNLADSMNKVNKKVQEMQSTVKRIETKLSHSIPKNSSVTLSRNIRVHHLESPAGNITNLNVTTMNGLLLDQSKIVRQSLNENAFENITVEVEELVIEESIAAEFLNGIPVANLLHTDDTIDLSEATVTAKDVVFEKGVFVRKTIDGVAFNPQTVIFQNMSQTLLGTFTAPQLKIQQLDTLTLNGRPISQTLETLHELVEKTSLPPSFETIETENLTIHGSFNGLDILALADITLKNQGDQRLEAEYDIETLKTSQLLINSTISGEQLSNFVRIDNGTFILNQDVQFASPLEVNDLVISERINDISVKNGKLDVLVKRSPDVQVVMGSKVFERLRLLGSIELQGKIRSESLEKMNPISTVGKDLVLKGDYKINGNVTVKRILNATNIFGQSRTHSIGKLLKEGVEISSDEVTVDLPVEFQQHIKVENLIASKLNNLDPTHFVKGNVEENQLVTGKKHFKQNLTIKVGVCDAERVNGVDLRALNATILKNTGDQEISGRIHFSKVIANDVLTVGNDSQFAKLKLSQLLTTNTQQILPSKVTIDAPVHVRKGLEVVNLTTSGQLFGHTMSELIKDTVLATELGKWKIGGDKYFSTCHFDALKVNHPNATFCNVNLKDLKDQISDFDGDLIVEETVHFSGPMHVKHLTFEHTLNGMRKDEFGTSWLLTESEQSFTEPQFFENLVAEEDVQLNGLLNNEMNLTELYAQSYSLNHDEEVAGEFEFRDGVVFQQSVRIDGTVAGINLSEQALLNNSTGPQQMEELLVEGNVTVTEEIRIDQLLNGVDYQKLAVFTGSESSDTPLVLKVLGDAEFQVQPVIESINGMNLEELAKNAWFTNDDVVFNLEVALQEALFDKMLYMNGPLNQVPLDYLIENYVSLTKPQEIKTLVKIQGNVLFENVVSANEMLVNGSLRGYTLLESLDIAEFDKFVLKKGVVQTITAPWHFKFVEITDNQQMCQVNGLNLVDDVLRYDNPDSQVTGHKQFKDLVVQNVNCSAPCHFGKVDMSEWIGNAVLNFGDYVVRGTTVLRDPVFYSNIVSLGTVNNLTFDTQTLFLKSSDQVVTGDMVIKTKFVKENRIWMMMFEHLQVAKINELPVSEFLENVARINENPLKIQTKLHFLQPLAVNYLQCTNSTLFDVNVSSLVSEFEEKLLVSRYEKSLNKLHAVAKGMVNSFESRAYYLNHFELRKSIYGTVFKVLPIGLLYGQTNLAVFRAETTGPLVVFHRWDANITSFVTDYAVPPLTSTDLLIITKVEKVVLHGKEYLAVEMYDKVHRLYVLTLHHLQNHAFEIAYQFPSNASSSVMSLQLGEVQCVGLYSEFVPNLYINCLSPDGFTLLPAQVIKTISVRQAVTLPSYLILLNVDQQILVLSNNAGKELFQTKQTIHTINPSYIAGVVYRQYRYLAVCSEKVESSIHYGMLEIYRTASDTENFHHFQTISIKIPIQAEFSVLPTQELMLYVLTNNPTQPVIIYQYAGAAGFKEFIQTSMIPRGQYLQVVPMPELQKEFVALVDKNEVVVIEACMKY